MLRKDETMRSRIVVRIALLAGVLSGASGLEAVELHVAIYGKDSNPGTAAAPFRTIQRAADLAQPGDTITVHAGVYREWVNPPRGGESDAQRIVYQAAPGETVEIKGSEIVKGWVKVQDDVWTVTIPNAFFGNFNPYKACLGGPWFEGKFFGWPTPPEAKKYKRDYHQGAVYVNGQWLTEASSLDEVLKPMGREPLWFGRVDGTSTTLWAQFKGFDPNDGRVEINVRQAVFYPDKPGRNYITVRGFIMRQAATPWAAPTAGEQIALVGTHWSKGWIIERNTISHSMCSGISLGKDQHTFFWSVQNPPGPKGWDKEKVGWHWVRGNRISHCEQAGIVGSLGGIFSKITDNEIHDIHVQRWFSGCEMAGIKLHGAVDVEISGNHIYRCSRGLWLDWMAQGTRISRNLFHDNAAGTVDWRADWEKSREVGAPGGEQDMFVEVNHGPFLVDNNLFLSRYAINNRSQGGMYVHNLIAGDMRIAGADARQTPFFAPHSVIVTGTAKNINGDDRFYNNIFVRYTTMRDYENPRIGSWKGCKVYFGGNIYLAGAAASPEEKDAILRPDFDPAIRISQEGSAWRLALKFDPAWVREHVRPLVTTDLLGKAAIPNVPFENPDGLPVCVDTDYFGKARDAHNPTPGPFEQPGNGRVVIKVR